MLGRRVRVFTANFQSEIYKSFNHQAGLVIELCPLYKASYQDESLSRQIVVLMNNGTKIIIPEGCATIVG